MIDDDDRQSTREIALAIARKLDAEAEAMPTDDTTKHRIAEVERGLSELQRERLDYHALRGGIRVVTALCGLLLLAVLIGAWQLGASQVRTEERVLSIEQRMERADRAASR